MQDERPKCPRKRLVVCCDGTWQALSGSYPTNVVKLAQSVKSIAQDGVSQSVFYVQGIGTRGRLIDKLGGGGFGWGIDENIQDAYQFLCLNYDDQDDACLCDEIYMFGFSRGAYTVRSLAGLIRCTGGLLPRSEVRKTPEAYRIYRSRVFEDNEKDLKRKEEEIRELSEKVRPVEITLLGCWDTVGALGVPNQIPLLSQWINRKYKFHNYTLSNIIKNALHAVAIDERRKSFPVTPMQQTQSNKVKQEVRQVWFPGTHGCIGGGTEAFRGLSDATLQWMIDQMADLGLGLELDQSIVEHDLDPGEEKFGIFPDHRTPFSTDPGFLYSLLGKQLRSMESEEMPFDEAKDIHDSVIKRWTDKTVQPPYRPANMPKKLAQKLNSMPIA